MNNRDKLSTLAGAAIVIGFATVLFAPAHATSEATSVSAEGVGYLPAQYVNKATHIEPMPATF
jgi:hypothetical protein